MLRLIAFLLTGCFHKWKIIAINEIFNDGHKLPVAKKYVLQCERCGDLKSHTSNGRWQ